MSEEPLKISLFCEKTRQVVLFFFCFMLPVLLNAQTTYFRVINGIPHLPVFEDVATATTALGTPETGMFIFSKKDATPMYYNGTAWVDLCSAPSWTGGVDYFQVKNGIPFIPSLASVTATPLPGAVYYSSSLGSVMVADGAGVFQKLASMGTTTAAYTDRQTFIADGTTVKTFCLPILAIAPTTGIESGAFYINGNTKLIDVYGVSGWTSIKCGPTCETSITVAHLVAGGVTPLTSDETITYGIVGNVPGELKKCWTAKNLGAVNAATAVADKTIAAAGWYWQFNKKQGYMNDGLTRYPGTAWITSVRENSNWLDSNDPCALELKNGWRIPTYTEWYNVNQTGVWSSWDGPWNSRLKLHAAGYLTDAAGSLSDMAVTGVYGSSCIGSDIVSQTLMFESTSSGMIERSKADAYTLRCIKDLSYDAGVPAQPGVINGSKIVCSQACVTYRIDAVPGATGYKWTYNGYGSQETSSDGLSFTICPPSVGYMSGGILNVVAVNGHGESNPRSFYIEVTSYTLSYGTYICKLRGVTNQKANPSLSFQGGGSTSYGVSRFYAKTTSGAETTDLKVDASSGEIDVSNSVPGFYTVCYDSGNGCGACAYVNLCSEPEIPVLAYPESHVCQYSTALLYPSVATPSAENPMRNGGTSLGGFTSDSGLVIDQLTGAINVGSSSVGTHFITYTPNPLCCPNSKAIFALRIDAVPTLSASVTLATCAKPTGDITLAIELHSPMPAPTAPADQYFCRCDHNGGYLRIHDLSVTSNTECGYVEWYDVPYGGTPLDTWTDLVDGKTYYASQCYSNERVAITVHIVNYSVPAPTPAAPAVYPPQTPCTWTIYNSKGVLVRSGTRNADGAVIASGLEPGVYYCQVTNEETGCVSNSVVVTIVAPDCLTYTLISDCKTGKTDVEFCITTLVTTAEPAANWTLTGNGTNTVFSGNCITIQDLEPGTYFYTAKTASGESVTVSFTIEKVKCCPPEIALGAFDCATKKGVVTISVPAGIAGALWNYTFKNPDGSTTSGTDISTGGTLSLSLSPGTYVFTFTDVNGNCDPVTITVTIECSPNCGCATPTWAITTAGTCSDKTTEVTISNLPDAVVWTINPGNVTGTATSTVLKLLPGTYTYTVTSADGCTSDPITIVVPCPAGCGCEALTYSLVRQPSCANETADVVLGNLPSGDWTINPGNIKGKDGSFYFICCLDPGTYSYTVSNADGCISAAIEFTIKCAEKCTDGCVVPPTYTITAPTCTDKRTVLNIGHLPVAGWSVTGDDGSSYSGIAVSQTIYVAMGQTVSYTIKDASGNVLLVISVTAEEPNCPCFMSPIFAPTAGECGVKGSVVISNLPITGWKITYDGITVSGTTATTTIALGAGTNTIQILNTATGCSAVSYSVNVPCSSGCKPIITVTREATCADKTGDISISGLPGSGTWSISPGAISGTGSSYQIKGLSPGVYTYMVTDPYGCKWDAVSITITEPDCTGCGWTLGATVIQPTCDNPSGSVTLTGWPNAEISITSADGDHPISASPVPYEYSYIYSILFPGKHSFTVTDVHTGCSKTLDVDLVYPKCCPPDYTITCVDGIPTVVFTLNGVNDCDKVNWTLTYLDDKGITTVKFVDGCSTKVTGLTSGKKYTFTYAFGGCEPIDFVVDVACPPDVKFNTIPDCGDAVDKVDYTLTDLPEGGSIRGVYYPYSSTSGSVSKESISLDGTIKYNGTSSEFNKLTSYGVYVYTIYDSKGNVTSTITIPVFPINKSIKLTVSTVDCTSGKGTFTVNPVGVGGEDWLVYVGATSQETQNGTSYFTFKDVPAGTYWVTVIDKKTGCMAHQLITVCP